MPICIRIHVSPREDLAPTFAAGSWPTHPQMSSALHAPLECGRSVDSQARACQTEQAPNHGAGKRAGCGAVQSRGALRTDLGPPRSDS